MTPNFTFIAPSMLGATTFVGADIRSGIQIESDMSASQAAMPKSNRFNVSMTALSGKQTDTVVGPHNLDNINYQAYDYVPVAQFTPLPNTNWFAAGSSTPGRMVDWTATMNVTFDRLDNPSISKTLLVQVQVMSYDSNSFRVRFNPGGPNRDFIRGPILKQQLNWTRNQELAQSCDPKMSFTSDGFLTFETKDLKVVIYGNFKMRLTRKRIISSSWRTMSMEHRAVTNAEG